jgi:uncharacterized membrane protein
LEAVSKFVQDTNSSTKNEQLALTIKSHALRRTLAKEIQVKFNTRDSVKGVNLYTDFNKFSEQFVIKRWAKKLGSTSSGTNGTKKATNPED